MLRSIRSIFVTEKREQNLLAKHTLADLTLGPKVTSFKDPRSGLQFYVDYGLYPDGRNRKILTVVNIKTGSYVDLKTLKVKDLSAGIVKRLLS